MSFEVYYFTGTGNSLVVAREIAEKIHGTLIPIPSVMDKQTIKTETANIVIVFPCYLAHFSGIPLIVEKFINKLEDIEIKNISAVCTCGGYECVNALPTLHNLAKLVKSSGGKISAEFSVRLPMNNLDYDHIPVPINRDHDTMFRKSKPRIKDICKRLIRKKGTKFRIAKSLFNSLMSPMYRMMRDVILNTLREKSKEPKDSNLTFAELMPMTDKSIAIDENCIGCGTCAMVCPVQNIKMIENKPVWQHHCEVCFACDEWCPKAAIQHWGRTAGVKYHHPDVKVSDMVKQQRISK